MHESEKTGKDSGKTRLEHSQIFVDFEKNKKKSDMAQMEYYSRHVNRKSQVSFAKENGVWVRPMPDIADPFSLEEKDIYYLKQWLQK